MFLEVPKSNIIQESQIFKRIQVQKSSKLEVIPKLRKIHILRVLNFKENPNSLRFQGSRDSKFYQVLSSKTFKFLRAFRLKALHIKHRKENIRNKLQKRIYKA